MIPLTHAEVRAATFLVGAVLLACVIREELRKLR